MPGLAEPGLEEPAETALLDAPGRREDLREDDEDHGEYIPVDSDKRRLGASGPQRRRRKTEFDNEALRGKSKRSKRPQGYESISGITRNDLTLGTLGLEEKDASIYSNSERRMLENTVRVRKLVEELEKKEAGKDET